MRLLFPTMIALLLTMGVGCKKDAPTCRGLSRCCSLLKSAGKTEEFQSLSCSDIANEKEAICQITTTGLARKIKDQRTRSMCSQAIKEEVFKKQK